MMFVHNIVSGDKYCIHSAPISQIEGNEPETTNHVGDPIIGDEQKFKLLYYSICMSAPLSFEDSD